MAGNVGSYYFQSDGLKLHYLSWGDENRPAIIMLHGIRSYANTWAPVAEALANAYRAIAPDLRGRGNSDWSAGNGYFIDNYVMDLETLIAHLKLRDFVLLGHSLGGAIALVYTARHPDKVSALIIEDIGPGSSASGPGAERIVREFINTPIEFNSWQEARSFWRGIRPNISEQSLSSRVDETLKEDDDGKIRWRFDLSGIRDARLAAARDSSKLPDLWACVDRLHCPTLVIRGSQSDFLSPEVMREMARRNPGIAVAEIPNATHYVHDDNPAEYLLALQGFLQGNPTQRVS